MIYDSVSVSGCGGAVGAPGEAAGDGGVIPKPVGVADTLETETPIFAGAEVTAGLLVFDTVGLGAGFAGISGRVGPRGGRGERSDLDSWAVPCLGPGDFEAFGRLGVDRFDLGWLGFRLGAGWAGCAGFRFAFAERRVVDFFFGFPRDDLESVRRPRRGVLGFTSASGPDLLAFLISARMRPTRSFAFLSVLRARLTAFFASRTHNFACLVAALASVCSLMALRNREAKAEAVAGDASRTVWKPDFFLEADFFMTSTGADLGLRRH